MRDNAKIFDSFTSKFLGKFLSDLLLCESEEMLGRYIICALAYKDETQIEENEINSIIICS
jgi:hypothetical protein